MKMIPVQKKSRLNFCFLILRDSSSLDGFFAFVKELHNIVNLAVKRDFS